MHGSSIHPDSRSPASPKRPAAPAGDQLRTQRLEIPTTDQSEFGRPQVRLHHVCKSFGSLQVFRDVSLEIPKGKTTVVLGPSGSGKSVMLKHLIGLIRPDRGEVWFEDQRIDNLAERDLGPVRQQFGFLFQNAALFDSLSVIENVMFPLVEQTKLSRAERIDRAQETLELVGMSETENKMPDQLSGGQRKRIGLARAIVLRPKVMLYDEPTTGLDPIRAASINDLIARLKSELQVTGIVVTHDLASAFQLADVMVMLYDGGIALRGTPQDFAQSDIPIIRKFIHAEPTEDLLEAQAVSSDPSVAAANSSGSDA